MYRIVLNRLIIVILSWMFQAKMPSTEPLRISLYIQSDSSIDQFSF